jgi:Flp pilus assembly protein TadG
MQDRSSFFFSFSAKLCAFRNDRGGAIAYLTAFLSLALVGLTGLAIDFGLMVSQRSKLDVAAQAAVNSAANAARNMLQLNMTQNSSFDAPALAEGERVAQESFDGQLGQTTGLNVTTKYVVMSRVGNTISAQLDYEAIATPYFAQMFNVNEFTLKGKASIIIGLVDNPPSSKLIEEGWQDAGVAASTFAVTTPSYRDWAIQGPPVTIGPSGDARAGASGALLGGGNNVLVKKVYMPAGAYELRYWYKSSVIYPEYQPVYICNAMGIDSVDWAISDKYREYNSSTVKSNSPRSAQLGVFLHPVKEDPRLALAPPPIANYVNRIDTCVY